MPTASATVTAICTAAVFISSGFPTQEIQQDGSSRPDPEHATGRQVNELIDLEPEERDDYIDGALARSGVVLTPPKE